MSLTEKEKNILESIIIRSENDPQDPEFPYHDPKFPATPTYKIQVPWFDNVWLKDESHNPTGTHKDRMAREIVVTYRDFLLAKKRCYLEWDIPAMSIISSGSAAIAIQSLLKTFQLPNLKVLVDSKMDRRIYNYLESIDCEVYETNLSIKPLTWQEILKLTHNEDGFDITANQMMRPTVKYYDRLSYEIINNDPDYCFIPFGTGNLYENILNINKNEVSVEKHDPRFSWDVSKLRKCNFMWITTNNPNSKAAEKLYSSHLPFMNFDEQWIRFYRDAWYCGPQSDVYLIREKYLDEAINIARKQWIPHEPSSIAWLWLMLQMKDKLPRDKKMLIVNTGKTKFL